MDKFSTWLFRAVLVYCLFDLVVIATGNGDYDVRRIIADVLAVVFAFGFEIYEKRRGR